MAHPPTYSLPTSIVLQYEIQAMPLSMKYGQDISRMMVNGNKLPNDTSVGVAYVGQSLLTTVTRQKNNQRKQHINDRHMTVNVHRSSAEDFKFPVHRHRTTRRPWISNAEETGPAAGRRCVVAATRCRSSAENYDSAVRRRDLTAEWSMSAARRELLASHAASPPRPYGAAPTTAANDLYKTQPPAEQISRSWQQTPMPKPDNLAYCLKIGHTVNNPYVHT